MHRASINKTKTTRALHLMSAIKARVSTTFYQNLSDQFRTRLAVTELVTRSCQLLNISLYKSSTGQRTLYHRMVHIWNNLDSTLKTANLETAGFGNYSSSTLQLIR